jgi:hypothetical protein
VVERFLLGYFFAGICSDFSEEGGKAFYFRLRRFFFLLLPPSTGKLFGGQVRKKNFAKDATGLCFFTS